MNNNKTNIKIGIMLILSILIGGYYFGFHKSNNSNGVINKVIEKSSNKDITIKDKEPKTKEDLIKNFDNKFDVSKTLGLPSSQLIQKINQRGEGEFRVKLNNKEIIKNFGKSDGEILIKYVESTILDDTPLEEEEEVKNKVIKTDDFKLQLNGKKIVKEIFYRNISREEFNKKMNLTGFSKIYKKMLDGYIFKKNEFELANKFLKINGGYKNYSKIQHSIKNQVL